jgi:hypothetical protein
MTCREFKHEAASRSLAELVKTQDASLNSHVESCANCSAWLEKQRALAASLHTLRAHTAGLEAGESVERALLRVFRQGVPADNMASSATAQVPASGLKLVPAGIAEHNADAAPRSTANRATEGLAWQLSRLFEFGAYAALAAAIAVAIFLGARLLHHDVKPSPTQAQSASQGTAPVAQRNAASQSAISETVARPVKAVARRKTPPQRVIAARVQQPQPSTVAATPAAAEDWQTDASAGYTALMFCDPLSCSSETQVVRMELPSSHETQPQMADVVVGYDGMVRAVRFVN